MTATAAIQSVSALIFSPFPFLLVAVRAIHHDRRAKDDDDASDDVTTRIDDEKEINVTNHKNGVRKKTQKRTQTTTSSTETSSD